jgi:hypothetical protein
MTSFQTLLEDEEGGVVNLYVYNLSQSACPGGIVAEGSIVAVLEPFFKVMLSGALGLRVDNPNELVALPALGPSSTAGWHAEGNLHFTAQQPEQAASCYTPTLKSCRPSCAINRASQSQRLFACHGVN